MITQETWRGRTKLSGVVIEFTLSEKYDISEVQLFSLAESGKVGSSVAVEKFVGRQEPATKTYTIDAVYGSINGKQASISDAQSLIEEAANGVDIYSWLYAHKNTY